MQLNRNTEEKLPAGFVSQEDYDAYLAAEATEDTGLEYDQHCSDLAGDRQGWAA